MDSSRKVLWGIITLVAIIASGVIGYIAIEDGDQLIVIGTQQQLAALEEALETSKPSQQK